MEGDDKNDGMLRDTVKSIDESPKSSFCTKKIIIITIVLCVLLAAIVTGLVLFFVLSDDDDSKDEGGSPEKIEVIEGLLNRQFPEIQDRFEFIIEKSNETFFEISTTGTDPLKTKIIIKGNNKLSLSSGLGYYLRYHALSQISWTGDSLKNIQDKKLPPLKEPIKKVSKLQYSYYLYSFVFRLLVGLAPMGTRN